MFDEALRTLVRHRCRFVVIGSTARALVGEQVRPHDLDVVIENSPDQRRRVTAALVDLDAHVEHRNGRRAVARSVALPWDWGFTVSTPGGGIDLITRFIDDTTIDDHDARAMSVEAAPGMWVRVHPTRHDEAA
jgi:hypothetical protein